MWFYFWSIQCEQHSWDFIFLLILTFSYRNCSKFRVKYFFFYWMSKIQIQLPDFSFLPVAPTWELAMLSGAHVLNASLTLRRVFGDLYLHVLLDIRHCRLKDIRNRIICQFSCLVWTIATFISSPFSCFGECSIFLLYQVFSVKGQIVNILELLGHVGIGHVFSLFPSFLSYLFLIL